MTGPDAVLARFLSPLAVSYVMELGDAKDGDASVIDRIAVELTLLCDTTKILHTHQLALTGVRVTDPLGPYKDVTLRPLSASERGAVLQEQQAGWFEQHVG